MTLPPLLGRDGGIVEANTTAMTSWTAPNELHDLMQRIVDRSFQEAMAWAHSRQKEIENDSIRRGIGTRSEHARQTAMASATARFVDGVRDEIAGLITSGAVPATPAGLKFVEGQLDRLIPAAGTPAFDFRSLREAGVNRVKRDVQIHLNKVALASRAVPQPVQAPATSAPAQDQDDRLPLRRPAALDRDLPEALLLSLADGLPLALLFIDIDHFKSVNDTHGHQKGDAVLLAIATDVKTIVGSKGQGYRYGGDEFCVVLPNHDSNEAMAVAERIRAEIAAKPQVELHCTLSIGVAVAPSDGRDQQGLLAAADKAVYNAKRDGRNRVNRFQSSSGETPSPRVPSDT